MKAANTNTKKNKFSLFKRLLLPIIGLLSVIWFLVRVVPKPSRALYPCQQAAFPIASAFVVWLFGLGTAALLLTRTRWLAAVSRGRNFVPLLTVVGIACFSVHLQTCADDEKGEIEDKKKGGNNAGADADTDVDTDADADDATVAITQAKDDAVSLTLAQIRAQVQEAVELAGGLGFISDGDDVVLKPNLVTTTTTGNARLAAEANGITTDWRIALSVAELVREENPSGKILIMEGSVKDTEDAFEQFGYTAENFGDTVDDFIPLEGASCRNPDTSHLVEATAVSGTDYWVDERYANADVVISLPVLKTHGNAGITGAIKNIGIGMIPAGRYGGGGFDCTRDFNTIDHDDPNALGNWIRDIYSINPADFAVMDGLRGCANGPEPSWGGGDYDTDVKNMRLILASSDAVALDTIESLVMGCDPLLVPHIVKASDADFGIDAQDDITVVGEKIADVRVPLYGSDACPGK